MPGDVTVGWASAQTTLTLPGMSIQGVVGLSETNTQLLKQRGVTGGPRQALQEQSSFLLTERGKASVFTLPA